MKPRWIGFALAITAGISQSQTQPGIPLAFEVASIRQHIFSEPRGCSGLSISGNRITLPCLSLRNLIMRAYDVRIYQIAGGAGAAMEIADIPYDIVAKAEGDGKPTMDQIRRMLQGLLADRFQLRLHGETKEVAAYLLVQGKKGSKLKESADNTKNSIRFSAGGVKGNLTASKETMVQFALYLSNEVGRPVSDKTGLTGNYDFTLNWTRDQNQQVLELPAAAAEPNALSADSNGPSIFTAVQEQLGLRLEAQKSSIDFLVIDHLAKPSEN